MPSYVADGLFACYRVVLCNSQVEVIAPRRAYVKMSGSLTILVDERKEGRCALKLDVTDFESGSLCHEPDRNSPHLVSISRAGPMAVTTVPNMSRRAATRQVELRPV